MSFLLLFIHGEEVGQKQLDRRRCIQTHSGQEYTSQNHFYVRRQRMDCFAGLLINIYIY